VAVGLGVRVEVGRELAVGTRSESTSAAAFGEGAAVAVGINVRVGVFEGAVVGMNVLVTVLWE